MAESKHPVRLNLKPVGQLGKFLTIENLNSWSLEVFPWSLRLWAIESHLYKKPCDLSKTSPYFTHLSVLQYFDCYRLNKAAIFKVMAIVAQVSNVIPRPCLISKLLLLKKKDRSYIWKYTSFTNFHQLTNIHIKSNSQIVWHIF